MVSSKEFFVNLIGASDYPQQVLASHDLCFQRSSESEPFCEIFTDNSGRTKLRVNSFEYKKSIKILL